MHSIKCAKKIVLLALILALLLTIALTIRFCWKSKAAVKETRINWDFVNTVTLQPFPRPCRNNPFLVIIVISDVGNVDVRNAHRTLITARDLRKINATRVFLVAQIPDDDKYVTQFEIDNESKTFGDIVQGTFIDNYRNLTYKHLMGLKWASTTCRNVPFILKVDDDTVYDLEITIEFLKSLDYSSIHLMGYINDNTEPLREKEYKFYVTWDEYPREEYPVYLSGWYYITTPQIAAALCDEAIYHPFFWIEDIFITGILTEALGFQLAELPKTFRQVNFMDCDYIPQQMQFNCELPGDD